MWPIKFRFRSNGALSRTFLKVGIPAFLLATSSLSLQARTQEVCDGVTYADSPSRLWVPLSKLMAKWDGDLDVKKSRLLINNQPLLLRRLYGTEEWVAKLTDLPNAGFTLTWDPKQKLAIISQGESQLSVTIAPKFINVDLDKQQLSAYQGSTLVLKTNISSGRNDWTPKGEYEAEMKERVHYSRLYNLVPMPFSILVTGNIFMHAFPDVPSYPASHGCIRLPLAAAEKLYVWVEVGTPISIQ